MGGRWHTTADAHAFLDAAGGFLRSRPASHSPLLTVADRLARGGVAAAGAESALLGWWTGADGVAGGAFVHTPPRQLLLAAAPTAAGALGAELAAAGRRVEGVNAEERAARAFADAFGASATLHQRHRMHRLETLVMPEPPPPGRARTATPGDRALLRAWMRAFGLEAEGRSDDVTVFVDDRLAHRGWALWETADGIAVSVAGASRAIGGAVRIGPVYTPPEHRRRGYGGAVTAALAAAALEAGAREVLLYTDLANPTSNALYHRLGFRPLEDRVLLAFE